MLRAAARLVLSDDEGHRQAAAAHEELARVTRGGFESGLNPGTAMESTQGRAKGDRLGIGTFVVVQSVGQNLDEAHAPPELTCQTHGGLRHSGSRTVVDDSSHHLGRREGPNGRGPLRRLRGGGHVSSMRRLAMTWSGHWSLYVPDTAEGRATPTKAGGRCGARAYPRERGSGPEA